MATEGQILNYLLAWDLSFRVGGTPEDILKAARTAIGGAAKEEDVRDDGIDEKDVDEIYEAYPSKDRCNNNRSLQKRARIDKNYIRKLLKYATKESLLQAIKDYVDECDEKGTYKKNFSTFLNGVNVEDLEKVKKPASGSWQ